MTRRTFSARSLMARLLEYDGKCAEPGCRIKLGDGERIEWDHIQPLAMLGRDDIDNLQPLCRACHKVKTATDAGHIAKGKRMDQRKSGIKKQPRSIIPGSKASGWKKLLNGQVVRR